MERYFAPTISMRIIDPRIHGELVMRYAGIRRSPESLAPM